MPIDTPRLKQIIESAERDNNLDVLEDLLRNGFQQIDEAPAPFAPRLAMRENFRTEFLSGEPESSSAVNWLNEISRAKRRVQFNLKIAGGFGGLILVEEGDSWTQYPVLLDDIVDQLNDDSDIAIFSTGAAGDIISNMARKKEYLEALRTTNAQGMILSGGGNDLLGDGALEQVLLPFDNEKPISDLIDQQKLERSVQDILGHYHTILSDVANDFPGVKVFSHGYDLPFPQQGGKWLGAPLSAKGIPLGIGRDVLKVIIDKFNERLIELERSVDNFVFADLRGVVDRGANSWFDELHPKNTGYGRAAEAIRAVIDTHIQAGVERSTGVESTANKIVVLDPGHGGNTPPAKVGGSSWNNAVGPNGTLEKNLTLDVAKRAKSILETRGFTVHLTRSADVNLGLKARAGVAKSHKAAVFISLHFNASENHNAQGTETFVHTLGNASSQDLCRAVQAEMIAALGLRDRNASHQGGVKKAGFGVLKPSSHSSVTATALHEVSFMDRTDEEQRLQKVSYLQKIAKALADGIETHLSPNLESFNRLVHPDEIGDAIEAEAFERGIPVAHFLAGSRSESTFGPERRFGSDNDAFYRSRSGGHLLGGDNDFDAPHAERTGGRDGRWLRRMAESLSSQRSRPRNDRFDDSGGNDINEFSSVDIGQPPAFDALGPSVERNEQILHGMFGGVENTSFDYAAYEAFINGFGLRHFEPAEFLYLGGGNTSGQCAGRNHLPARALWPNIANAAQMLDEIRDRLGAAVTILSCYRSLAYNSCIGGEPNSLHLRFNAIDWTCTTGNPRDWADVAKAVRASNTSYRGGVGIYTSKHFVHTDTRGTNANWGN